ncbi:IS4 family transposase [Paenibacillus larvae]|uniref:IS4 family transposase n=1 Tax=Paenibacillus larvae TaxID=1464 RepID=UPI00227E81F6|nr:IS4 family transposase [Paenibacillus larvae]MCY9746385.1 IS4 family transposase [Paenibacillus larvae]MCY9752073.1 IS4 family transposase [Paenibacillus larvae]
MDINIPNELALFSQELQRHLSPHVLQQLARKEGFVQRTSKFRAQDLVALCVWLSQQVASTSLNQLCSTLETTTGVLISSEGLNQRFNPAAVRFLQQLVSLLLQQKLHGSGSISSEYANYFSRIRILDSTTFQLPDIFAASYQGTGGCSHTAGIKIQLEYDLQSGEFVHLHTDHGKLNDKTYGSTCLQHIQPKELFIRDLGYFCLKDLHTIHDQEAYYVSRLKLNTRVYLKNEHPEYFLDGTIKKKSEYLQLSMEDILERIQPGETLEIPDVYVGMYEKLPTRLVIYRLTDTQIRKRDKDQEVREKKKGITYSERSKKLSALNFYITNIPTQWVPSVHLHDLYSLRWQIEILFKTWKSFFKIHHCKEIKMERLECHLYGQLIGILLCSTTMFQMRRLLWWKKKELSEYKAFYMIKDYMPLLHQTVQKNTQEISKVLLRLFHLLEKNGRKSHRYEKKTVFDILGVVYEYSTLKKKSA